MTKRKLTQRSGVEEITGYGRSWITETINPESDRYDPTFPKPFKIANTQTNIWVVNEVYAWVDAQIEKGRINQVESFTEQQNTAQK